MKDCKACGHQNWSDDDFCANCGKALESIDVNDTLEPPRRRKTGVGEFSYLIYWIIVMIISGIVLAILYFFFGFWIEIISFIIIMFVIFGFLSAIFLAIFEWVQENKELKKKRLLFNEKKEKEEN